MIRTRYPSLYQIHTRIRLSEIAGRLGRPATLDDVPDEELDRLAADGFDLVWFLGVWQTGEETRRLSVTNPEAMAEYRLVLPDLRESDVCGSCFAIREYRVHDDFGGDAALSRLRKRMGKRGLRLILDFVPNHVGTDHPWVQAHPGWFVAGDEALLAAQPKNYVRAGDRILAHGRDPNFAGWSDTLQLNYGEPALQEAMLGVLRRVASMCDGVRCDMAMLLLPEVFERTWNIRPSPFWPKATAAVLSKHPEFLFLAEVYWDFEWALLRQGFRYAYDKRLYDRLEGRDARAVHGHLEAGLDYQDRLARFLENHDEPRAAATLAPEVHRAAAVVAYLTPGLKFFHEGQKEGKRIRIPVQLARGPFEPPDPAIASFYDGLLAVLRDEAFRSGRWELLEPKPAWEGNPTAGDFVAFAWTGPGNRRRLVAVNYSDHRGQCFVPFPWTDLRGKEVRLQDRLGPAVYDRPGDDLAARGLYLDLPPWGHHVFELSRPARGPAALGKPKPRNRATDKAAVASRPTARAPGRKTTRRPSPRRGRRPTGS